MRRGGPPYERDKPLIADAIREQTKFFIKLKKKEEDAERRRQLMGLPSKLAQSYISWAQRAGREGVRQVDSFSRRHSTTTHFVGLLFGAGIISVIDRVTSPRPSRRSPGPRP